MIVGILGHVAEQDSDGWCHMGGFVEGAAPATALCKSQANMCRIFYLNLCSSRRMYKRVQHGRRYSCYCCRNMQVIGFWYMQIVICGVSLCTTI